MRGSTCRGGGGGPWGVSVSLEEDHVPTEPTRGHLEGARRSGPGQNGRSSRSATSQLDVTVQVDMPTPYLSSGLCLSTKNSETDGYTSPEPGPTTAAATLPSAALLPHCPQDWCRMSRQTEGPLFPLQH